MGELRVRARAAESRTQELEALLARFSSGEEDPGDYVERLKALEDENGDAVISWALESRFTFRL